MGTVFKKTVTRPVPADAEVVERKGERIARWRDRGNRPRSAPIVEGRDGTPRIRDEAATYTAKYRDGGNLVVEAATGCRDKSAALAVLAELERKAERIRSGLVSPQEARTAEHLKHDLRSHLAAYLASLEARGVVPMHRDNVRRQISKIIADCGFARLADLDRERFERWLADETAKGRSARSRNAHRAAMLAFCNWAADPSIGRLPNNSLRGVPKADEKADPRRRRRAMTEDELGRLLATARDRPLRDASTVRRGKQTGMLAVNLQPETRQRLEALGRERALIYKALVLTGLRKGELASLAPKHLRLDAPIPHVELDAANEKNREGNSVVVRADLADDLRAWLADRLDAKRAEALKRGEPVPLRLDADEPIFEVPAGLVRIFDRDLKAAGISKRDDRGRTLDVHGLRTTFGTLLSRAGVPLRTAQEAMRHSDPSLTANVYIDPRLLDVAGAIDALPRLALDDHAKGETAAN